MAAFIYKITNKINGKSYIGQTIRTIDERWAEHCSVKSDCAALRNAIQKYGVENFEISVLANISDPVDLNKKELKFINHFKTLAPNGYNLKFGGFFGKRQEKTKTMPQEVRDKISKTKMGSVPWNKGKKLSEEQKKNMSLSNLGNRHTKETRNKISESMKIVRAKALCQS